MPATLQASPFRKASLRLAPFLALLYFAAFIDRAKVIFAAPSNLVLHRAGGRRLIARSPGLSSPRPRPS